MPSLANGSVLQFRILILAAVCAQLIFGQCVPFREAVLRPDDYYLDWTADMDAKEISFHVVARTTGYVGLGLSDFTGMFGADLVIGGVFPNGTTYLGDYYSTTNANTPELDESQDWFLDFAAENGTHTELVFHRAFETGDVAQDHVITEALTTFIWSYGQTDALLAHGSQHRNMYLASILNFPDCFPPPDPEPCLKTIKKEALDPKYTLFWAQADCTRTLHFHVVVEGTGYVGFGFSYAGNMFVGDVVIGGVFENGTTYFGDYHTAGTTVNPELDDSQDWFLTHAVQNETHTELKFWRKYDTGDDAHDSPITTAPVHVIWSFGLSDNIGYHFSNRAARLMALVDHEQCLL